MLHIRPAPPLVLTLLAAALASLPARAAVVTVPFDVGVGPAPQIVSGPVARDQTVHLALRLSMAAVIDRETIARNRGRIPPKYRAMASKVSEVRIRPSVFIPDTILVSPAFGGTGLYGATWSFLGVGLPLIDRGPVRLRLGAEILLTLAFLHSSTLRGLNDEAVPFALFLRPGVGLSAEVEIRLSRRFFLSFGWRSAVHVPQVLRTNVATSLLSIPGDAGALRASVWHFGAPFLLFHVRFPVTRRLPGGGHGRRQPPRVPSRPPPRRPPPGHPPSRPPIRSGPAPL